MLLPCSRVQVLFPQEKICLESEEPAPLLLDEHGGTLILKAGDLKLTETAAPGEESGFFLEVELTPGETLVRDIKSFAVEQNLTLPPAAAPPGACLVRPILAACHLPGPKKFIFAEKSTLEARPGRTGVMDLAVRGEFKARTVPCQEADLVIHLAPLDLTQLLAYLLALIREAG
ncbi:MAG: hypothetical protein PHU44_03515 [Syntrophales bacterium]|nr:hypothetical protein [Syntrophales bacterium]MDD5641658.1 hypothetical protein [Syntrophales bacterium]